MSGLARSRAVALTTCILMRLPVRVLGVVVTELNPNSVKNHPYISKAFDGS